MNNKNSTENSLINIAKFISGEKSLEEKQKRLTQMKVKAKQSQANTEYAEKEDLFEEKYTESAEQSIKADPTPRTKVVQNIPLYEWKAPIRQTFPFDMKIFMAIVAAALIFIIYLAILGNYGLMGVLIALLFVIYAAGTTKPIEVKHRITARGIDTPITINENGKESIATSKLYEWYTLDEFAFYKKNDQILLVIDTKLNIPSKLIMLVDKDQQEEIFMLLQDKLLYKDIRKQNRINTLVDGQYVKLEEI